MSRLERIRLMKMYHNLRTSAQTIDELEYYHERIMELIRSYSEEDTVPQKGTRLEKIRTIKEYVQRMMDSRSVDEIEYLHERIMALIQQLKDEEEMKDKTSIYFVNEEHQRNYKELVFRFPEAKTNGEYAAGCYIVSYPEIFKGIRIEELEHGPFDWYFREEKKSHLTGATLRLVQAGLNLYNGEPFNLVDGIVSWDEELYRVFLQALELRRIRG